MVFERIKRFFTTPPADQDQQSQVEPVEYKGYLIYVAPVPKRANFVLPVALTEPATTMNADSISLCAQICAWTGRRLSS